MSITPGKPDKPFIIVQSTDFSRIFTWRDENDVLINLTGYSARFIIRNEVDSSTALVTLTSSPAAGVTLGGAAGTITIAIDDAVTALLPLGELVWGLQLTGTTGLKDLLLHGDIVVIGNPAR